MNKSVKKLKTSVNDEIMKNHTFFVSFLENPKSKVLLLNKEGKTLTDHKERADRWQQNVVELYNDSEELEKWKEK